MLVLDRSGQLFVVASSPRNRNTAKALEKELAQCGCSCSFTNSCFPDWVEATSPQGNKPLGDMNALRDRVTGHTARERADQPQPKEIPFKSEEMALIHLEQQRQGSSSSATLGRPWTWVRQQGIQVGSQHWLDRPEMGLVGWCDVKGIEPSPPIPQGEGRLVTAVFRHGPAQVYDLRVQGEPQPIGVTASHPFWSVDRGEWVPVGQLREGERLLAEDGSTPMVEAFTPRPSREMVVNIEVDGDHCYRVGEQGLLVHNASAGCDPCEGVFTASEMQRYMNGTTIWRPQVVTHRRINQNGLEVNYSQVTQMIALLRRTRGGSNATPEAQALYNCRFFGPDESRRRSGGATNRLLRSTVPGAEPLGDGRDAVGHIIGYQFGGRAEADSANIFPQNAVDNDGGNWARFETQAGNAADNSANRVCVKIAFTFDPGSVTPLRPTGYTVEWWVNGMPQPAIPPLTNARNTPNCIDPHPPINASACLTPDPSNPRRRIACL